MTELAYEGKATKAMPVPPLREVLRDAIEMLAKEIEATKEVLMPVLGLEADREPMTDRIESPHSSELAGHLDALFATIAQLRTLRGRIEL